MIIITNAPSTMAMAVPSTPELGRNFFPGFMNAPQPMIQPKAIAHTCVGDNCFRKYSSLFSAILYSDRNFIKASLF